MRQPQPLRLGRCATALSIAKQQPQRQLMVKKKAHSLSRVLCTYSMTFRRAVRRRVLLDGSLLIL